MTNINAIQGSQFGKLIEQESLSLKKKDETKFSETLKGMLDQYDELHSAKGEAIKDFIAGKNIHLHEVMAIGEEAQISFQFILEMRNKLMESYQEISRMQV